MESGTDISTLIGTVVARRFRIESLIGAGAMGVVFRANLLEGETHATGNGGSAVALKIVLPDARQQRTVPRLLRGARLASQVKHPHVVETLAHGRLGRDHDGYYVAMELVEGVSLGR
ncbi:MAG TPA: protein kinase, partial [Haliangium sp.]|nr:protein kinase [Haliangium sp.]